MALSDLDSDNSNVARSAVQELPAPLSNPDTSHKLTSGEYDSLDDLLDNLYDYGA